MNPILENIHIVLVEPKNPGNIGSVVRAMKNMGIHRLRLVNPVDYRTHPEQKKMGYRSQEIIESSREFSTLSEALADMSTVFLATARRGKWKRNFYTPKEAAPHLAEGAVKGKAALVFGREDKGVTIEEAQLANAYIKIPSAVAYPSLNLSQAVMVIVYEVYQHTLSRIEGWPVPPKRAEKKSFERITGNIWNLMKQLEVREPEEGLFHRSLKRALSRTQWTNADIAVFDRFCKQVRWYVDTYCGEKKRGES